MYRLKKKEFGGHGIRYNKKIICSNVWDV
jgi:hypothetical protein